MATAELVYAPADVGGGTAYEVQTYPNNAPDFSGPDDRSWNNFVATNQGATFEWRTANDSARDLVRKFLAGTLPLKVLLADDDVREWYASHADNFTAWYRTDHPDMTEPDSDEWDEILIREYGVCISNDDDSSVYMQDDDRCLRDAAYSLDLPDWAEVVTGDSGGVGFGYTAAYIVLSEDKSLRDLEAWLAQKVGSVGS